MMPPVTEDAVRTLRVEIALSELEALRAAAASAHRLAREIETARAAVEDCEARLESARQERDEARAEVRRLSAPASPP
jgi:chromosome segregation ATPase